MYTDLRAAPASLESQTNLNLNLVISELESARQGAAVLKEEAQLKETVLEKELHRKNKIIEELEMNLKKLQKNFSMPRKSVMKLSKVM